MFTTSQANRANYASAAISIAIFLVRIAVGRWRRRSLDLAFFFLVASIVATSARITLNHYVLRLGTVADAVGKPDYFLIHDPADVATGSKLILAARVAITTSLWLQICLLLLFYSQVLQEIRWIRVTIWLTWLATGASYVVVVILTFLECRPFEVYWQIDPRPGTCPKAYAQLLSQCICNTVLDLMLLAISFPILMHSGRSWGQHLRVGILFMLGTFCLVVTVMRLTSVYSSGGAQATRTLWGAIQMIVSAFVANVPTIYGDVQVKLRKRQESKSLSSTRPESWTRSTDEEVYLGREIPQYSHDEDKAI